MSDTAVRLLRDGALEGESAPVLVVSDTVDCNSGPRVFHQLVQSLARAITSDHAQAKRLVILAIQNPPELYHRAFEETSDGSKTLKPSSEWLRVVDCFSDPLGWARLDTGSNDGLPPGAHTANEHTPRHQSSDRAAANDRSPGGDCAELFQSLGDLGLLTSAFVHAASDGLKDQRGSHPASRCCVVIDSFSALLRHHSLPALMSWLEGMTWQGVVSSILLLIHSDLHPPSVLASLHYLANATFTLEPPPPPPLKINHGLTSSQRQMGAIGGGEEEDEEVVVGAVRLRQKRRNGKVREVVEVYYGLLNGRVRFSAPPIPRASVNTPPVAATKGGGVKVREWISLKGSEWGVQVSFKVEVSEREREERAKVVLPYEHQGEGGRSVRIYDGRQADRESQGGAEKLKDKRGRGMRAHISAPLIGMDSDVIVSKLQTLFSDSRVEDEEENSGEGHIHYLRNSDDDVPDSDEDLDDDLDI